MEISSGTHQRKVVNSTRKLMRALERHSKASRKLRREIVDLPPDELDRHTLLYMRNSLVKQVHLHETLSASVARLLRRVLEVIDDDRNS